MKSLVIKIIEVYQIVFSVALKNLMGTSRFCRFKITCSEFAKIKIRQEGVLKGSVSALNRILKCQPFGKVAYE